MLVKLPTTSVYRVSPKGVPSTGKLGMGIGLGRLNDRPAELLLMEVGPELWSIEKREGLDLVSLNITGECVGTVGGTVHGYILPAAADGRVLPRHVVMVGAERFEPFEDVAAAEAVYGALTVGHLWGPGDGNSYQRCWRCRDTRWCDHSGAAGHACCPACGTPISR